MTAHHCHDCGHDFADDLTATTAPDATPAEDDDDAPPDDWAPVDLAPIAEAIPIVVHELRAIAALIAAHEDEFRSIVGSLAAGDVVSLADHKRAGRR